MLPFARNEATRFISPTKTPEYLAAGRPVVSTSMRDVVRPYGERGAGADRRQPRRVRRRRRARRSRERRRPAARRRRVPARTVVGSHAVGDRALDASTLAAHRDACRAPRRPLRTHRVDVAAVARGAALTGSPEPPGSTGSMFDYLIVGAGFAGSVLAERLAAGAGKQGAAHRQAPAHRRQRLRPLRRRRRAGPQVRAAHLPHQLARRLRLPVAVHRVAARTSTACGLGRRPAGADPDQPRHHQHALRH